MIINHSPAQSLEEAAPINEADLANVLGEVAELAEISTDLITETANVNLAMARFEHAMYVTEAEDEKAGATEEKKAETEDKKKEGVGAWFKKQAAAVWEWVKRFKAWIVTHVSMLITKVFGAREAWLKKHKSELMSKSAFGDAKASWGSQLDASRARVLVDGVIEGSKAMVEAALKVDSVEAKGNFQERAAQFFSKIMKSGSEKSNAVGGVRAFQIGEIKEEQVTKAGVEKAIAVAEAAYANVTKLKGAATVADALARAASGQVQVVHGDSEKAAPKLQALAACGPLIAHHVAAATSANTESSRIAMAYLVRAYNASEGKKPEPAEPVKETSTVLDSFF